jgi:hypothetical protein
MGCPHLKLKTLVFIFQFYINSIHLKSFDLVPNVVATDFCTRSKVVIMELLAFKTFNLVPKYLAQDRMHY